MATLKEPVKIFIVQSLACFETPQQVVDAVREEFGIEIERQQVASYDPTKATCRGMSKKLKTLFEHTREHFKKNIYDIPLANKAVRLNELQKMYVDWKNNKVKKQSIIKQVKDEMHGYEIQLLDEQLKQLEIDRIKNGDGEGADDPTPVKVTIQVVDASKENAEHKSDPECTSFLDDTAKRFKLTGGDVFDLGKSAEAAAKYLQILYKKFGSWDKAISAYHAGEGNVDKGTNIGPVNRQYVQNVKGYIAGTNGFEGSTKDFDTSINDLVKFLQVKQDIELQYSSGELQRKTEHEKKLADIQSHFSGDTYTKLERQENERFANENRLAELQFDSNVKGWNWTNEQRIQNEIDTRVWTIGFGTIKYPNGVRVKKGDVCTESQAEQYLRNDLVVFENAINRLVKVPLNQNQFDALASFTYNLGEGNLSKSTLLKKLNVKDYKGAAAEFPKWNKAGGRVLAGLVKRRKAEMELFLK